MDNGDVWKKGPMATSNCALVNGPKWRRVEYSCCTIVLKWGGVVRNRWSIRRYKCVVNAGYADDCTIL
jgi:hypothetical protein